MIKLIADSDTGETEVAVKGNFLDITFDVICALTGLLESIEENMDTTGRKLMATAICGALMDDIKGNGLPSARVFEDGDERVMVDRDMMSLLEKFAKESQD